MRPGLEAPAGLAGILNSLISIYFQYSLISGNRLVKYNLGVHVTKVFVSYSWGTEKETKIVDDLERLCQQRDIELIRDNITLKHGESIKSFMDELSKGDHVITVFSKPYFESKWCMYELLRIYQRGDFQVRTHPVIADACDLQDSDYRLKVLEFWHKKYQSEESKLKNLDPVTVLAEFEHVKLYKDIYQNINELLNFAAGRVTTPLAELQKKNYIHLLDRIKLLAKQHEVLRLTPDNSTLTSHQRPVWIDRDPQWYDHILARVTARPPAGKTFAFVVAGVREEWPESFEQRMCYLMNKPKETQIIPTFTGKFAPRKECGFWSSILQGFLNEHQLDSLKLHEYEAELLKVLSQSPSQFFSWRLNPGRKEHLDVDIIEDVVKRWESLVLAESSQPHYLMIFYGCEDRGFFKGGERKVEKWRQKLMNKLAEPKNPRVVVPKLESPKKKEINYWMESYHPDQKERLKINRALAKKIKWGRASHLTLVETYLEIYRS